MPASPLSDALASSLEPAADRLECRPGHPTLRVGGRHQVAVGVVHERPHARVQPDAHRRNFEPPANVVTNATRSTPAPAPELRAGVDLGLPQRTPLCRSLLIDVARRGIKESGYPKRF